MRDLRKRQAHLSIRAEVAALLAYVDDVARAAEEMGIDCFQLENCEQLAGLQE